MVQSIINQSNWYCYIVLADMWNVLMKAEITIKDKT